VNRTSLRRVIAQEKGAFTIATIGMAALYAIATDILVIGKPFQLGVHLDGKSAFSLLTLSVLTGALLAVQSHALRIRRILPRKSLLGFIGAILSFLASSCPCNPLIVSSLCFVGSIFALPTFQVTLLSDLLLMLAIAFGYDSIRQWRMRELGLLPSEAPPGVHSKEVGRS